MKIRKVAGDILIFLNILLLVILLFESRIIVPGWLQVFGRMHPLLLHFPIVISIAFAVLLLFAPSGMRKEKWFIASNDGLLLIAALTASITAIMGLLLSKDGGYDADDIALHKWSGVLLALLLHVAVIFRHKLFVNSFTGRLSSIILILVITIAGHYGATITHGENFILSPIATTEKTITRSFEDALLFEDLVQPILEKKCVSCHNQQKAKGELMMQTKELLLKGGKSGKLWDTSKADLGLMMNRIHLAEDAKKHMPPAGKPQLTEQELVILENWIRGGTNFEIKVSELEASDTLFVLAKQILPSSVDVKYDFEPASEQQITQLSNNNRVIAPISMGSPALAVNFYNRSFYKGTDLKQLAPIADNIVELSLVNMPVTDDDLLNIKSFRNLRKLNLNFTNIKGTGLQHLQGLNALESISLSGTPVEYAQLRSFELFPQLNSVVLWNTGIDAAKIEDLKKLNKKISYIIGFSGDTVIMQLTPPILTTRREVIDSQVALKFKHNVKGVIINYTLDGTDPDSARSPKYSDSIMLDASVTVKAKAFKQGWISSEVISKDFYRRTFIPDTIILAGMPGERYRAKFGVTLYDGEKSELNYGSGKWIGFYGEKLSALCVFKEPVTAASVTVSLMHDVGAHIFPPSRVEVWGGNTSDNMKLLASNTPDQPRKLVDKALLPITLNFQKTTVKYIKVIAYPVMNIPVWHEGKGKKAHVFADEIFIN